MVNLCHGALGNFPEERNHEVHDSADRGEVVEGNQGVHLKLSGAQETLDHGQPKGLEADTTDLVNDTNPDELDLTNRGDDDTNNYDGHIEEDLQVGLRHTKGPAGDQNSNRGGGLVKLAHIPTQPVLLTNLEHLDKGDTEVEVGKVAADQAQAEEEANRDNRAKINTASHLDSLPPVKISGVAGENLGHDGRKAQVVGGQDDRIP